MRANHQSKKKNIFALAFTFLCILKASVATNKDSIRGRQSTDDGRRFEQDEANEDHKDRWIVRFKSEEGFDTIHRQMQSKDADPHSVRIMGLPQDRAEVMTLSSEEEVQYWNDRDDVAYVEPDYIVRPMAENIPYGISAVKALSVSDGKVSNQKVCIIDSGYDINHPDLPSSPNVVSGENESWSTDESGHGTHVAGTIAALGGNGRGVVGVNRNGQVKLHVIKVFNGNGDWIYTSDLIRAAERCVEAGSTIINMSLGGPKSSVTARDAFNRIFNEDNVLLVAASGNDGSNNKLYPASYPSIISVAAVDSSKKRANFSQYNEGVDLAAPGVGVLSTTPGGGYSWYRGTSMATPHVAGVAALVWSHFPNLTAKDIRKALESSAEDLGPSGKDVEYGYGLVRADRAYNLLLGNGAGSSPDKAIQLQNRRNGKVADLHERRAWNRQPVNFRTKRSWYEPAQMWKIDSLGRIRSIINNDYCLEAGTRGALYAKAYVYRCHSGRWQQWEFRSDGRIKNKGNGWYLGVAYCGTKSDPNKQQLELRHYEDGSCGTAQKWSIV